MKKTDLYLESLWNCTYGIIKSFWLKELSEDMGIPYNTMTKLFHDKKTSKEHFDKSKLSMFYWAFKKRKAELEDLCNRIEYYFKS